MVGFIPEDQRQPEVYKPMLASQGDADEIAEALASDLWVAEPKLDGSRYIAAFTDDAVRFTSRRTSVKTNAPVDKTDNVPHLALPAPHLSGTVLDGEIMTIDSSLASNSVTRIMGAKPEKAIARQEKEGWLVYHVWDILFRNGVDVQKQPLSRRRTILEDAVEEWSNRYVRVVEQRYNKQALLDEISNKGGEGIILKNLNSVYVQDKRSSNWIKVKKEQTYDVVITGYDEPKEESKKKDGVLSPTKYAKKGWIGAIRYGCYRDGQLVEIGSVSGLTEFDRDVITRNADDFLGQAMEIKGQEVLKDAIRHPRFMRLREDKDPKDCKWEDIFGKREVKYK